MDAIHHSIHHMDAMMDPRVCATLSIFHGLTGCDTASAFRGRGKKTAWDSLRPLRHLKTSCTVTSVAQPCQCWSGLLLCCMTAPVMSWKSMLQGSNFSHRNPGAWRTCHKHWQHWSRISRGYVTSPIAGTRLLLQSLSFQAWKNGAGERMLQAGSHSGPPFWRHHSQAMSCFIVAARRVALGSASAIRLP